MRIKPLHFNFNKPTKGTEGAGAYDLYMPVSGSIEENGICKVGLGFAAEVPADHVALILPRSGIGAKYGVELNNSCGVIDSDYRGEWLATLKTKDGKEFNWTAGDRLLQFVIVPVISVELEIVDELSSTERGTGGFGSSGK